MDDSEKLKEIRLANQLPLNQAARKFLPAAWEDGQRLHVLSLMWWGIQESDLKIESISPSHPTQDDIEEQLIRLWRLEPSRALKFLTEVDGEIVLHVEELQQQESPEEAAWLLLETLHSNMVATAP